MSEGQRVGLVWRLLLAPSMPHWPVLLVGATCCSWRDLVAWDKAQTLPRPATQTWGRSAASPTGWRNNISKVTGSRCWRVFTRAGLNGDSLERSVWIAFRRMGLTITARHWLFAYITYFTLVLLLTKASLWMILWCVVSKSVCLDRGLSGIRYLVLYKVGVMLPDVTTLDVTFEQ